MKKSEITVGGLYRAKVSGRIVTVKVEAIRPGYNRGIHETTVYDVLNTATGRRTTFRSAAKFRGSATMLPDESLVGRLAAKDEDPIAGQTSIYGQD